MLKSSVSRPTTAPVSRQPLLVGSLLSWIGSRWLKLRALNELNELSDSHLKDIGIDRREIGSVVDRELSRLRRSDLAWHK